MCISFNHRCYSMWRYYAYNPSSDLCVCLISNAVDHTSPENIMQWTHVTEIHFNSLVSRTRNQGTPTALCSVEQLFFSSSGFSLFRFHCITSPTTTTTWAAPATVTIISSYFHQNKNAIIVPGRVLLGIAYSRLMYLMNFVSRNSGRLILAAAAADGVILFAVVLCGTMRKIYKMNRKKHFTWNYEAGTDYNDGTARSTRWCWFCALMICCVVWMWRHQLNLTCI